MRIHSFIRCTRQFSVFIVCGATIFAKLRTKIAKSPKIGGKVHIDCCEI